MLARCFPGTQLGLFEGLEVIYHFVDKDMCLKFFHAMWEMAEPLEEYAGRCRSGRTAYIAGACKPWTAGICVSAS